MADLYVCVQCGETEDCGCTRVAHARAELRKAQEKLYAELGRLLSSLVTRMPKCECETCSKGGRCPVGHAIYYAKSQVPSGV